MTKEAFHQPVIFLLGHTVRMRKKRRVFLRDGTIENELSRPCAPGFRGAAYRPFSHGLHPQYAVDRHSVHHQERSHKSVFIYLERVSQWVATAFFAADMRTALHIHIPISHSSGGKDHAARALLSWPWIRLLPSTESSEGQRHLVEQPEAQLVDRTVVQLAGATA